MKLTEFLARYEAYAPVRMHMPGHKGEIAQDLTEIATDFGDVVDCLRESNDLVARAYGADRAVMLTGGATIGILCAITAMKGAPVVIARASHKSVFSACVLGGSEPVVVDNVFRDGLPLPMTACQVQEALRLRPDARAVLVTSPDYYGRTADVASIRRVIGDRVLIVDCAHGAHFGLSPLLPKNPCDEADCVICSAHKTLPSMTQTAIALVRHGFFTAFDGQLKLLASTSPSYVLLASIERGVERARAFDYAPLIALARRLKGAIPTDDPTRIVLDGAQFGCTGYELEAHLKRCGIVAEFGSERYCVLILTCADTVESVQAVERALESVPRGSKAPCALPELPAPERVIAFTDCARMQTEAVPVERAEGRVAGQEMGFYPPCTPILVRGEIIRKQHLIALTAVGSFGLDEGVVVVKE